MTLMGGNMHGVKRGRLTVAASLVGDDYLEVP
jgi:hypothetical protein